MDEWGELLEFTQEFTSRHGLSHEDHVTLDVILEEVVTNILKYGGMPPDAQACSIELLLKDAFLEIKISDNGTPFNPLLLPKVDTDKGIEDRPIGGLGIHFVKNLTLSQHYEYKDGKNFLTLVKELKS
jgi:anti-sigma regulatory factor (Ser/Thr protein kinase)